MKLVTTSIIAAFGLFSAQAAVAGGYTPAVVDPVVAVEPTVAPGDWQGAYGGVTLGYAFNADDEVGFDGIGSDLGNVELNGIEAGLRVGYRWQRNKLVIGPELAIEGGSVDDTDTINSLGFDLESKLKHKATLRLKTGYEVRPETLVFGTVGYTRGSFEYSSSAIEKDYTDSGFAFGLGVERKVNERMSVTGEVEHSAFKGKWIEEGSYRTKATPRHTNVRLGLNFKF